MGAVIAVRLMTFISKAVLEIFDADIMRLNSNRLMTLRASGTVQRQRRSRNKPICKRTKRAQTAIHFKISRGHEGGIIAGKPQDRRRNFFRTTDAPDRMSVRQLSFTALLA